MACSSLAARHVTGHIPYPQVCRNPARPRVPHAENLSHMAGRTGYGEGGDEDESHGHVFRDTVGYY